MAKERNQHKDVLQYLKENGSITQLEAYREFPAPITRLAAIICDLRKEGHLIESTPLSGQNCYGKYTCVKYVYHYTYREENK